MAVCTNNLSIEIKYVIPFNILVMTLDTYIHLYIKLSNNCILGAKRCSFHHSILARPLICIIDIGFYQGDRTQNIGVVDSEYLIHQGIPTLGGHSAKKVPYQIWLIFY